MSESSSDMSLLTIASYLHRECSNNDHMQQLLHQVARKINDYEKLVDAEKSLWELHCHLSMETFTLESVHGTRDLEQHANTVLVAEAAYTGVLRFCEQLRRIDMTKLRLCDIQSQQRKMEAELCELQQYYAKKRALYGRMESRHIMQELRRVQKAKATATTTYEETIQLAATTMADLQLKVDVRRAKRNQLIVNLVRGLQELNRLREEHQAFLQQVDCHQAESPETRASVVLEDPSSAQAIATTSCREVTPTTVAKASGLFDPLQPMNFLKSLDFDAQKFPSLLNFFEALQEKKQRELSNTALHSILRVTRFKGCQPLDSRTESPKRVHFLLKSDSSSCASSVMGSQSSDSSEPSAEGNGQLVPEQKGDEGANTPIEAAKTHAEAAQVAPTKSGDRKAPRESKTTAGSSIEILDCRTIKQASSPLPQVLPTSTTPATAKEAEIFKVPTGLPKKSKRDAHTKLFDDLSFLSSPSPPSESSNEATNGGQDLQKQTTTTKNSRNTPDFESMLLESTAADTDDDSLADEAKNDDDDGMLLDFQTSDFIDDISGADDKFTLDFSDDNDSEPMAGAKKTNNFL